MPKVSIVILNFNHPEIIEICLKTLKITSGVSYEVVVVDNGSAHDTPERLKVLQQQGFIDVLVLEPDNHLFSEGNNIGVRNTDPSSEYILMLNSDVAFVRPDWLEKQVAWIEGRAQYWPSIWGLRPTVVKPGPLNVVSIGWSYDASILPSMARPEGWCCMIRHNNWIDLSPDFPWHYGFEEAVSLILRGGGRVGVLSQYNSYLVHLEGGSGKIQNYQGVSVADSNFSLERRPPEMDKWFKDQIIETLDFTLGPDEHQSYLWW